MSKCPELKKEDELELQRLNNQVQQAIVERREWLDNKMIEYSDLKIGDDLYDLRSGKRLGKINKIYRYWSHQNPLMDDKLSLDYEYEIYFIHGRCFDNTSRNPLLHFGSKEEAKKHHSKEKNNYEKKNQSRIRQSQRG